MGEKGHSLTWLRTQRRPQSVAWTTLTLKGSRVQVLRFLVLHLQFNCARVLQHVTLEVISSSIWYDRVLIFILSYRFNLMALSYGDMIHIWEVKLKCHGSFQPVRWPFFFFSQFFCNEFLHDHFENVILKLVLGWPMEFNMYLSLNFGFSPAFNANHVCKLLREGWVRKGCDLGLSFCHFWFCRFALSIWRVCWPFSLFLLLIKRFCTQGHGIDMWKRGRMFVMNLDRFLSFSFNVVGKGC